MDEKPHDL